MISSLKEFDRIADRIKLARQQDPRSAVIVEGPTDRLFLARILPEVALEVYVAGSRRDVLEAADDVVHLHIERVACVVDRDFDDEVSLAESRGLPVATYDNADLEAMLWFSTALDDLVQEVGSNEKLQAFGGVRALRRQTFEVLRPLSRLRRANSIYGWGLDFRNLDLQGKLNLRTLALPEQPLCDALWHTELGLEKRLLYEATQASSNDLVCPQSGEVLVRGRDALAVVGVALRRIIGSLRSQQAATDRIEETLRLAANERHVASTYWLASLKGLLAA